MIKNKRILPSQLLEKAAYQTTSDVGKPISSMGVIDKRPSRVINRELSPEEKQKIIKKHEERMARRLHSTGLHNAAKRFERSFDDSDLIKGIENGRAIPEVINKDKIDFSIEKAISSIYTTPGALSSKRSGGYEGVKLMKKLDERVKGKKEPKVEVTRQYRPTSPVRDKEAYGMGGAEKSYSLDFSKSILKRMGLIKGVVGIHEKESTTQTGNDYDAKANKSSALSFPWNYMILEKGRKAAWQKEPKGEDEKEAMMPGRLMGDPGSRIHERKRISEIGESGRAENLKRMAASKDPADVKYAKKYGY